MQGLLDLGQVIQAILSLVNTVGAIETDLRAIVPSLIQGSGASGFMAFPGGGQANATQLTAQFNEITVVAAPADSVKLLPSAAGLSQAVANAGANATQIFGTGADTINGAAAAVGVSIPAGKSALFFCVAPGAWFMILSA